MLTFLSELLCVISATVKSLNKILKFFKAQKFKVKTAGPSGTGSLKADRTWEVKK